MNHFLKIILLSICLVQAATLTYAQNAKEDAAKEANEAIKKFTTDTKKNPKDSKAWAGLGAALLFQGKTDEAITAYRMAIEIKPDSASFWISLGKALLETGQFEEAVSVSRKAIEIAPKSGSAWSNLGGALARQGKIKKALEATYKATGLMPSNAAAWTNHGAVLWKSGKSVEAIEAIRKSIALLPTESKAWGNLGIILVKTGKIEEGIEALTRSIQLDDQRANEWSNLGEAFLLQGKIDESIEASKRAVQINPNSISSLGNLVRANGKDNRIERAGIWMSRWVMAQLDPSLASNETAILLEVTKGLQVLKIEPPIETPPDSAVAEYYQSHKNDFTSGKVHLGMISCPKTKHTRKSMEELWKKLNEGGDFKEVARNYSDDSAAADGGDRGWMKRGDLRADLADIAFALQIGKISSIIEDTTHYRILRVEDRKAGSPTPMNEVRERIVFKLKAAGLEKKIRHWILQAKKELKDTQSLQKQ